MRIIELNTPGTELIAVHKKCGAKIGYYANEVKSFPHTDYGGGTETVYYIVCPHCGAQIQNVKTS
jgi:hypothetical protein